MKTPPLQHDHYDYAFQEAPDQDTINLLKEIPTRWGRMPPLSRLLVVETGRFLEKQGLLKRGRSLARSGKTVGLIGGTSKGSLTTDLAFAKTLEQGPELASPALFGYTLANTPLAEAANHYGLTGPVYAIIDANNPFQYAIEECKRFLTHSHEINFMLACHFDDLGSGSNQQQLQLTFSIIE